MFSYSLYVKERLPSRANPNRNLRNPSAIRKKKPQVLLILRFFCMVKPYCGPKTKGLLGLEFKDRGGVVCFTGAQYGAWKFILVGRVREVLGFKAESVAVIIRFAFFPAHSF